jgi:hypothetical protein
LPTFSKTKEVTNTTKHITNTTHDVTNDVTATA